MAQNGSYVLYEPAGQVGSAFTVTETGQRAYNFPAGSEIVETSFTPPPPPSIPPPVWAEVILE